MTTDDRFETALETCARRVRDGEPLDRCLLDYPPEHRDELARLAPVAGRVASLRRDPSPAFQIRLERHLLDTLVLDGSVTEAGSVKEAPPKQAPGGIPRRLLALAPKLARPSRALVVASLLVLMLVLGGVGVVQASDSALPDSPLYGVKTAREWVEVTLTPSRQARAAILARQVAQRGRELEQAVRLGKAPRVVDQLTLRLAGSTQQLVDVTLDLAAQGNPQPARRTLTAIRTMRRQVDLLTPQARPASRAALNRLGRFLDTKDQQITTALGET